MRRLLRLIDRLGLGLPEDFAGDPYGWATNGLSHVALGAGGAWLGGQIGMSPPVVLAIAAAIVLAVEVLHLGRGGSWRDGLVDAGLVLGGAVFVICPAHLLFAALVATLAAGTWLRAQSPEE